jgi:DNA-binding transcriptional MerR regulator
MPRSTTHSATISPPRIHMNEACALLGISKGTMLRYEAMGFFPPPRRNQANGYRCYTQEDIASLRGLMLGEGATP